MSELAYQIRRDARTRRVRIAVRPDGSVVVTAPRRVSEERVRGIVADKRSWIAQAVERLLARRAQLPPDLVADSQTHYLRFKERARALAHRKVKQWNIVFGFEVKTIRIKRQRTQWGSCSSHGNLNFNYKVLFLPEHLQDYLIVHELCHLAHMNHSPQFWKLVGQACPNHRSLRRALACLS